MLLDIQLVVALLEVLCRSTGTRFLAYVLTTARRCQKISTCYRERRRTALEQVSCVTIRGHRQAVRVGNESEGGGLPIRQLTGGMWRSAQVASALWVVTQAAQR
jgi:hypothetical protein